MQARVYKSTGSWYIVKGEDNMVYNARIKGVFKTENLTSTNPIAVGDIVNIELEHDADNTVTINKIDPRNNYVARQSPHNKWKHHIIASNLDQSILFCTLRNPKTSAGFVDRFLASCEAYHIPAIIVFNKLDIYTKKDLEQLTHLTEIYTNIGYKVLATSVAEKKGIEPLRDLLKNKTTLVSGHSGVGKSTLLNALFPELDIRTQEVSDWSGKGLHTTTFAEMHDLPEGGAVIDTPGIREFGIVSIEKHELAQYFAEMKALMSECAFNNCVHINEPNCAIKDAVNAGIISVDRYASYLTILETMNKKKMY
jgi:ribosome biogenesis GTPase / thiamine phosphate phosphatase